MSNKYLTVIEMIQQAILKKSNAPRFTIDIQLTHKFTGKTLSFKDDIYAKNESDAEELRLKIAYRIYENSENKLENSSFGLMFPRSSGYKKRHAFFLMVWKDPAWKRSISKGWAPQGIAPFSLLKRTVDDLRQNKEVDVNTKPKNEVPIETTIRNILIHISMYFVGFTACICYLIYLSHNNETQIVPLMTTVLVMALIITKIVSCIKDYTNLQNEVNSTNE